MENKRTAVDWLFLMINNPNDNQELALKCFKKAKEIEKEQIMNAWYNGFEENRPYVDHSEDYYNDTYKQQGNEK